jgi:uncharacterized damage-inducible protein DinB
VHHLRGEFLPRIRTAVERLGERDLWWRPNAECTSAGNLLLHLEGNVRQWILGGIANRQDQRDRASEFDAEGGADLETLLNRLEHTVEEACEVITAMEPQHLLERRDIQVFEGVSGLAAVLHVVEHFSWHTGQVAWIAKQRTANDLGYYDMPLE